MSFACRNEKGVHDLYQQNVSLLVKAENKFDMDTNSMSYGIDIIWTTKGATVHFRDLKELTRKHTFRNTKGRCSSSSKVWNAPICNEILISTKQE